MRWNFFVVDADREEAQHAAAAIQKTHPAANVAQFASGTDTLAAIDAATHSPSLIVYEFDMPDMGASCASGAGRRRFPGRSSRSQTQKRR